MKSSNFLTKIDGFVNDTNISSVSDLTDEGMVLFNTLSLIIDIQYGQKTSKSLDHENARGYSKSTVKYRLGSHVDPVDDGFLGY